MKKILFAAALMASGTAAFAQSHQFSFRTGTVSTPRIIESESDEGYKVSKPRLAHWSGEIGYGRQARNGFRLDVALQHFTDGAHAASEGWADYGGTLTVKSAAFGLRFSAGYDLMRLFGPEKRFRLTAGLALQPALFSERVEHNYSDFVGRYHEDRYTNRRITAFAGAVLNPEYKLCGDWWLSGHLGIERRLVEPLSFEGGYDADLTPGNGIRKMFNVSLGIARQF